MLTVKRTILSTSVVLLLAAGLTGCAATSSGSSLVPDVASAAASAAAPTPKTGDIVDATEAKVILKAGDGQRAYPLADGTFVVVTKTEPLPAAVQADIEAKANVVAAEFRDASADLNATGAALGASEGKTASETGKRVISVWGLVGFYDSTIETKGPYWNVNGGPANSGAQFATQAEARAFVDAWLAAQPNANEYVVVYAG